MRRAIAFLIFLAGCATTPPPAPSAPEPAAVPAPPAQPRDPEAWRARQPRPGAAPALTVPAFQKAELPNGLTVYVSPQPELPLVSLSVAFRAGAGSDPRGKGGVANLAYGLLLEGAGKRDALQLADAFGDLGVSPQVQVGSDGAVLSTTVLKRNADAALSLLTDVVRRPRLAAKDFERKKKQQLADLVSQAGRPFTLALWAAFDAVFGKDHPYGHPSTGLPDTVGRLRLADARRFYREQVGPKTTALIVTGRVTLDEAQAWAKQHFGSWKAPAAVPPAPAAPPAAPRTSVVVVPKPGLKQTVVLAVRPGLPAGHADLEALEVANEVYGGMVASRLSMNLREQKGYTYGARSGIIPWRGTGLLLAGSQVRADATGDSVAQVMLELRGLKERPITAAEMEGAREGLVRQLPGRFETMQAVGGSAAALYWRDLPLDHYQRTIAALQKLDLATVRATAERYFDPPAMKLVLVGDPGLIEKQVPPLGLGSLVTRPAPAMPQATQATAKKRTP